MYKNAAILAYVLSHITAISVVFVLVFPLIVIEKPLARLWRKLTPPHTQFPGWIFYLTFTLLMGIIAVWIDYEATKIFTLGNVIVSAGIWLPLSFLFVAMGAEDHSGKKPKSIPVNTIVALLVGAPLGGLFGGIYFLTDAHIIPYQTEIGNQLLAWSSNLCGLIAISFIGMVLGIIIGRRLKSDDEANQDEATQAHST